MCARWHETCSQAIFCSVEEDTFDFCTAEEVRLGLAKPLENFDISPTVFCEKMGYHVIEAPECYNGEPLAKTLTLQPNKL